MSPLISQERPSTSPRTLRSSMEPEYFGYETHGTVHEYLGRESHGTEHEYLGCETQGTVCEYLGTWIHGMVAARVGFRLPFWDRDIATREGGVNGSR
jgi:hypothetical protein